MDGSPTCRDGSQPKHLPKCSRADRGHPGDGGRAPVLSSDGLAMVVAENLEFEEAAGIRDQIHKLKEQVLL